MSASRIATSPDASSVAEASLSPDATPPIEPAPPAAPALEPLRTRIQRATTWTTIAYGASQVLRLVNNVILTALFVNHIELLGLLLLASIFLQALQMFSDIGTGPSIIQHHRGDKQEFLNTAWTMQIIRGFGLWIASSGPLRASL